MGCQVASPDASLRLSVPECDPSPGGMQGHARCALSLSSLSRCKFPKCGKYASAAPVVCALQVLGRQCRGSLSVVSLLPGPLSDPWTAQSWTETPVLCLVRRVPGPLSGTRAHLAQELHRGPVSCVRKGSWLPGLPLRTCASPGPC